MLENKRVQQPLYKLYHALEVMHLKKQWLTFQSKLTQSLRLSGSPGVFAECGYGLEA